jgi:CubicO group peptidase (beta-lactamase class C family)
VGAGTASGYHAMTQGYLVGEVVRRVAGVSLGEYFAKELAGPLGADLHIGTGPEYDHRVASVIPPPPLPMPPGADETSIAVRTLTNPRLDATESFTIPWRRGSTRRCTTFTHGRRHPAARARRRTLDRADRAAEGVRVSVRGHSGPIALRPPRLRSFLVDAGSLSGSGHGRSATTPGARSSSSGCDAYRSSARRASSTSSPRVSERRRTIDLGVVDLSVRLGRAMAPTGSR